MANSDDIQNAPSATLDWRSNDPVLNRGAYISLVAAAVVFMLFLVLELNFGVH